MKTFKLLLILLFISYMSVAQEERFIRSNTVIKKLSLTNPTIDNLNTLIKDYNYLGLKIYIIKYLVDEESNCYIGPIPLYIVNGYIFNSKYRPYLYISNRHIENVSRLKNHEAMAIHKSLRNVDVLIVTTTKEHQYKFNDLFYVNGIIK